MSFNERWVLEGCLLIKVACIGFRFGKKHFFQSSEEFGNNFIKYDIFYMNLPFIYKKLIYIKPTESCCIKIHHVYFNNSNHYISMF